MANYLDRYMKGECESVWTELLRLGDAIQTSPLAMEAQAVANETMERARKNVEMIVSRLNQIGYEFGVYPDGELLSFQRPPYIPPNKEYLNDLKTMEEVLGPLPLAVKTWCQKVGSVTLLGRKIGWPEGLDPLVVEFVEGAKSEYKDWKADHADPHWRRSDPFEAPFAPDELHKDNVSGGLPYSIALPNHRADSVVLHEWHNTTFVNYLRICFRYGGFPGIEKIRVTIPSDLRDLAHHMIPI